ncbi:hypothetical protein D3C78_945780 [compost metagenome]
MTYQLGEGNELIVLMNEVEKWAEARNLIEGSTPHAQFHKLIQEAAELSESICKGKDATDDIGDVFVVLIILAKQLGLNIVDCLAFSYDEIKDRKGKMVNGVFVKEE